MFDPEVLEALAAEYHKLYCNYHRDVHGEEYWTKGEYDLLDEYQKEEDRYMARFILETFERRFARFMDR